MGRNGLAKYVAAASIVLPGAALLLMPEEIWTAILFVCWTAAAAAFWIISKQREHEEQMTRTIKAMQSAGIRTLNHHRHDWMNDLQVLFGYARLGKLDKCISFMENIRERMAVDSAIAKLGVPSLVSYIQSFRTISSNMLLELEIQSDLNLSGMRLDHDKIADTLIHAINTYRLAAKPGTGELAVLRLTLSRDNTALYAAFYYEGELINEQQWSQKMIQQLKGAPLKVVDSEHGSNVLLRADISA